MEDMIMKLLKAGLLLVLILFAAMASAPVLARGGHGGGHAGGGHGHFGGFRGGPHVGVFVGAPLFLPGYYYPPPYYYPPYYSSPEYIEQGSPQGNWWYYCAAAGSYYPNVTQCPSGWQRVAPHPG
jgi:hypothetical protein